jgi:hypothetical protein
MVNKYKYSLVACAALTFGVLCASDLPIFSLVGLEGEELRKKAHAWTEIVLEEFFQDSAQAVGLLELLDKQQFTADFGDPILRQKIAFVLFWQVNFDSFSANYDQSYGAGLGHKGYDVEDQADLTAVEFRYWMLHKILWDVTRPCYENPKKTELIKWSLFPFVHSMACKEDKRLHQQGVSLFSEFYFSRAIFSNVPNCVLYYDELVYLIMSLAHKVCMRTEEILRLSGIAPEVFCIHHGMLIEVIWSADELPRALVNIRELYSDEANPLPDWASVLVRGGETVTFSPGHTPTFVPHGEGGGGAGAGGGSAGASCS